MVYLEYTLSYSCQRLEAEAHIPYLRSDIYLNAGAVADCHCAWPGGNTLCVPVRRACLYVLFTCLSVAGCRLWSTVDTDNNRTVICHLYC